MPPPSSMLDEHQRVAPRIAVRARSACRARCASARPRARRAAPSARAARRRRRRRAASRRRAARRAQPVRSSTSSSCVVLDVPRRGDDELRRMIRALVQLAEGRGRRARTPSRACRGSSSRTDARPTAPRCAARTRDRRACRPPSRSPRAPPSARASRSVARSSGRKTRSPMTSAASREMLVEHARLIRPCARATCRRRASRRAPRATARSPARCGARVPLNTMCSSRCDTPICSRGSCSEAARTQAPNATDRTPGMCSESTVSPFGKHGAAQRRRRPRRYGGHRATDLRAGPRAATRRSAAAASAASAAAAARRLAAFADARPRRRSPFAARRRSRLRHAFRLRHQRLHRQAQASALVAIDELHLHAVALLHDVFGLLGAAVLQLGDVHEAFGARHDLDERAERRRALHRALVRLADHRLGGERLHHLARALHRLAADGGDRDETRVVDRELGARLVLDAANRLALRSDQVADLLGADLHRHDARRVRRQIGARLGERLVHLAEDVQAAFLRLRERFLHDLADRGPRS